MPTVEPDQHEPMRASSVDGKLVVTVGFFCKDLDNPFPGQGEHYRMLSAYSLPGMPRPDSMIVVFGKRLYAKDFDLEPWPPADCAVRVTYREAPETGPIAPVIVESGSTYEQAETDFEAAEMLKPFASRKPLVVTYESKWAIGPQFRPQSVRVPVLVGKAFRRYTIPFLGFDPGELAERFVTRTNVRPWRPYGARVPYRPDEVMCLSIVGRNAGQGWEGVFDFAIDKVTRFHQVARWVNPENGQYPELTAQDLARNNGIKDAIVQFSADFNQLPIPK